MVKLTLEALNQYSSEIYSNDKALRQKARSKLIKETNFFKEVKLLTVKEKEKYPDWHKISSYMRKALEESVFAYQLDANKAGEIHCPNIFKNEIFETQPYPVIDKPGYIMTMAHTPKISMPNPVAYLSNQIDLLWNESFGKTNLVSQTEFNNRVALVIGANYCHTLDSKINKKFKHAIEQLKAVSNTRVQLIAFSWKPIWVQKKTVTSQIRVKRFFRLLADTDYQKATKIFKELMSVKSEIIPYQRIRNEIKNSSVTSVFYREMKRGNVNRPLFLGILDDDAVKYRTEKFGLLTQYDRLITSYPYLEVASTGYYMTNPDEDFVEFASRVDLVARIAICYGLANGGYLPEPNLIIKIDSLSMLRNKISFLRKSPNTGKGLEYLGLLENLNLNKGNANEKIIMGRCGPIITAQPERATVAQHIPSVLTHTKINNKKNLASLRMFCQSVLNPKKGFAASVARAMPTGTGSAANTAHIAKLYTALDPIDYIKTLPSWLNLYESIIDALVDIYNKKMAKSDFEPNYKKRAKNIAVLKILSKKELTDLSNLLENKSTDIWTARTELVKKGQKLSNHQFWLLFISALNANSAVFEFLKSRINNSEFVFPELLR